MTRKKEVRRGKKKKGIKTQRTKPHILTWDIDMLIGDEEQNGKQMKEEKNE